ncbi:hypothetical protein [Acinetobacter towneri]|uniref:hypothetical protein n=1 Tax=Acinetobacter towneri TaxID=202956 RepID=UPI002096EE7F|nr:hypothetical protein [Acinetobacter towneri]MCO8058080.1 hypothetical protein [Acinetobacter towneri]MCO8063726.1 hypothetical protein [Acinetobacter towneri]
MSELQDLFEQSNPIPKGITRCGDHYAQTEYMLIDPYASNYAARFKGFMEGIGHQQAIINSLKAQLNNMEVCYIERKKQVEAVNAVLMNWQDEYTEYTHQHECTVDAVLRTCITELEQAMRGASD